MNHPNKECKSKTFRVNTDDLIAYEPVMCMGQQQINAVLNNIDYWLSLTNEMESTNISSLQDIRQDYHWVDCGQWLIYCMKSVRNQSIYHLNGWWRMFVNVYVK